MCRGQKQKTGNGIIKVPSWLSVKVKESLKLSDDFIAWQGSGCKMFVWLPPQKLKMCDLTFMVFVKIITLKNIFNRMVHPKMKWDENVLALRPSKM